MRKRLLSTLVFLVPLSLWANSVYLSRGILDPQISYADRKELVESSGYKEVPTLLEALSSSDAAKGMTLPQRRAFLNEIMNKLRRMNHPEMNLEKRLVTVAQDEQRDPAVRQYAQQHLGRLFARSDQQSYILDALTALSSNQETGVSALYQLHLLKKEGAAISSESIASLVRLHLAKTNLRNAEKLTLLKVVGQQKLAMGLPQVRDWAEESDHPVVVLGSIEVLGKLGSADEAMFLKNTVASRDMRFVKEKIEKALRDITQRLAKTAGN